MADLERAIVMEQRNVLLCPQDCAPVKEKFAKFVAELGRDYVMP